MGPSQHHGHHEDRKHRHHEENENEQAVGENSLPHDYYFLAPAVIPRCIAWNVGYTSGPLLFMNSM
jgi:hypothetical protein